jgi:uncharacterized protein YjlB
MNNPIPYFLKENLLFPNSPYPALHYKRVLNLIANDEAKSIINLFLEHNWTNNWEAGIFTYHHYHSNTHEAIGIADGSTELQLGGDSGKILFIEKGDVLVIPAGVAHKNLGSENQVTCVGGYPDGKDYDMNYGKPGERPGTDKNIAQVPMPSTDPVYGKSQGLVQIWTDLQHTDEEQNHNGEQ